MTRTPDHIFDEWLVLRAQGGEVEAMNELVRRWNRRLRAHAQCLLNDPAAAADATQDAWYDIIRTIRRLDDPAAYRVWMYRIVSRRCADQVRGAMRWRKRVELRRHQIDDQRETPDGQPLPTAAAELAEDTQRLGYALSQLSGELRALLALRYRENFPLAAIAVVMGCPSGTVKSRLHEARRQLHALLAPTHRKD